MYNLRKSLTYLPEFCGGNASQVRLHILPLHHTSPALTVTFIVTGVISSVSFSADNSNSESWCWKVKEGSCCHHSSSKSGMHSENKKIMSDCEEAAARVGYALEPKKIKSFIQPSLIDYAKQNGINLVQIDPTKPLNEQGPFHCIIHKLHTQQWKTQLHEFSTKHPNTIIIDPPKLIDRVHNRVTMLESVTQLQVASVPSQVVVNNPKSFDFDTILESFSFPVIVKPLEANGSTGSHELSLVFDRSGFNALTTPIVLQEFVNHGGVVFKIYVAGQRVICVKRKSLGDISEDKLKTLKGSLPFSQVSNLSVKEGEEGGGVIDEAEMPPQSLIDELARRLREALGLNLFNADVIRDSKDPTSAWITPLASKEYGARVSAGSSSLLSYWLDTLI